MNTDSNSSSLSALYSKTRLSCLLIFTLSIALGCTQHSSDVRDEGEGVVTLMDQGLVDERALDMEPTMSPDAAPPTPEVEPARGGILAGVTSRGHWDGVGAEARFDGAVCLAPSPDGRFLWISDAFSGTVRRLEIESGEVSTAAGRPYELAVLDGAQSEARFESPRGCAVSSGASALGAALWVADSSTIRRLSLDEAEEQVISVETVAGRAGERGSRDGVGDEARLGYLIHDLAVSPSGDALYLADRSNDSVRSLRMEPEGARISLVAGGFDGPGGLAWWGESLIVADTFSGQLKSVNTESGEVTTIARALGDPQGVAVSGDRAWVAGFEGTVTQVDLNTGEPARALGDPEDVRAVDGELGELRLGGAFASLRYDEQRQRLYYMDISSEALRALSLSPVFSDTIAGPSGAGSYRDGALSAARFGPIFDIVGAPLAEGRGARWFVTDPSHYAVRELNEASRKVLTLLGGEPSDSVIDGPLSEASAVAPMGLAYDPLTSSLYVSDYEAHVIRRIDLSAREVSTVAGQAGLSGSVDGGADMALLDTPLGLALSPQGELFFVDGGSGALRALELSTGEVSTRSVPAEGLWDVMVSAEGEIYASDELDATLLRLNPEPEGLGSWEVAVGQPGQTGPADGVEGLLARPLGLSLGAEGQILIADADNHSVRAYDPLSGALSTFVGSPSRRGGQGAYELLPWEELSLYEPSAVSWLIESGRGGVSCEGALYGLWSEEGVEPEPPAPPPPLNQLPVGDFEVRLGTSPDAFTALSAGDQVTLHRGCQGAQHIWVSLQIPELDEEPHSFELSLVDSERSLASLYLEAEPWLSAPAGGYQLIGLSLVVFDAEAALDRPLVLGAEVQAQSGAVGYGWREVSVVWGADSCGN